MAQQQQILFNGEYADIVLDNAVSGFLSTIQNALVIVGTNVGSDEIYLTKGTALLQDALSGGSFAGNQPTHISNIAAVDALYFMRTNSPNLSDPNEIDNIVLQPATVINGGRLELTATFTAVNGIVVPSTSTF